MSHDTPMAWPPRGDDAAAFAFAMAAFRSAMTIRAPSEASRAPTSAPMPPAPPKTTMPRSILFCTSGISEHRIGSRPAMGTLTALKTHRILMEKHDTPENVLWKLTTVKPPGRSRATGKRCGNGPPGALLPRAEASARDHPV